ncbi:CoA transferase [Rhodococcus wratislaviensis]|uniref:CoA transferase n=1 Tax=Rhodococcus wratislaviensis TaxID=44752 RepID=UPI003653F0D1
MAGGQTPHPRRLCHQTRAEWTTLFAGAEACVTPVNAVEEVTSDPHVRAREIMLDQNGIKFPRLRRD